MDETVISKRSFSFDEGKGISKFAVRLSLKKVFLIYFKSNEESFFFKLQSVDSFQKC